MCECVCGYVGVYYDDLITVLHCENNTQNNSVLIRVC